MERIRTEITNDYELGLETLTSDSRGKPLNVSIKVARPDVVVRASKQLLIPESPAAPADRPRRAGIGARALVNSAPMMLLSVA